MALTFVAFLATCLAAPAASQNYIFCNAAWNEIIKYEDSAVEECVQSKMLVAPRENIECALLRCNSNFLVNFVPGCARFQLQICQSGARHAASNGVDYCGQACDEATAVLLTDVQQSRNASDLASGEITALVRADHPLFTSDMPNGTLPLQELEVVRHRNLHTIVYANAVQGPGATPVTLIMFAVGACVATLWVWQRRRLTHSEEPLLAAEA